MPETENEIEAARKQLSARFEDATNRARELTDAWVRYLVAINGGAIGVTFGLASASDDRVSPLVFGWPVVAFTAGLICAGVAVFLEHKRQDERANTASKHMTQLANGKLTANQSRDEWDELLRNQGKSPWTPPRKAALLSFFAFLVGIGFSLWALSR